MAGRLSDTILKSLHVLLIMVPMLAHFLLICFALLSTNFPPTFLFSHIFFVLFGGWCCIDRTSVYPVIMFIVVIVMTMLLDIIQLGLFFGPAEGNQEQRNTRRFSQGMTIMSLIFKPLTCVLASLALYIRHTGRVPMGGGGDGEQHDDTGYNAHGQDGQQAE